MKTKLVTITMALLLGLTFSSCDTKNSTNQTEPDKVSDSNSNSNDTSNDSSKNDDSNTDTAISSKGSFIIKVDGKEINSSNQPVVVDNKIVSTLFTVPASVSNPYVEVTLPANVNGNPLPIGKGMDPTKDENYKGKSLEINLKVKASDLGIENPANDIVGVFVRARDNKVLVSDITVDEVENMFKGKLTFKGAFTYATKDAPKEIKQTDEKEITFEFSLPYNDEGTLKSAKWPDGFAYDGDTGYYK